MNVCKRQSVRRKEQVTTSPRPAPPELKWWLVLLFGWRYYRVRYRAGEGLRMPHPGSAVELHRKYSLRNGESEEQYERWQLAGNEHCSGLQRFDGHVLATGRTPSGSDASSRQKDRLAPQVSQAQGFSTREWCIDGAVKSASSVLGSAPTIGLSILGSPRHASRSSDSTVIPEGFIMAYR
jgi:hypothetical protein